MKITFKKSASLMGLLCVTNLLSAQNQTFPDNVTVTGKLGIGITATSTSQPLTVYRAENPAIEVVGGTYGRWQFGLATCNDCYATGAIPGDGVIRTLGASNNTLLIVPNITNNGNHYIGMGDGYNGIWAKFRNNKVFSLNGKMGIGIDAPLAKFHNNSGANNNYAAILATSNEGNNLVISSFGTQPTNTEVFRISHEYFNNPSYRNNGYISFYRGGGSNGGFLEFGSNGLPRMTINPEGNIGIGRTSTPYYKLDVQGTLRACEVKINLNSGADFVFEKDYNLMPISDLSKFITENKHLPDIAPAAEMTAVDTDLGELVIKLLQKVEEQTLYIIEMEKRIKDLEKNNTQKEKL